MAGAFLTRRDRTVGFEILPNAVILPFEMASEALRDGPSIIFRLVSVGMAVPA